MDMFVGGQFEWFTGVVEDIMDPEKLNRVRVRCFGYHSDDLGKIKTEDLPWATVMMPTTLASVEGFGGNHGLLSGSWVIGFFRDGPSAQDPIIMGSIASQTTEDRSSNLGFSGDYGNIVGIDLPEETQTNYPYNYVTKTHCGHKVEYDNTLGEERINIEHTTGTTFNIDKDGTATIDTLSHQMVMNNPDNTVTITHKSGTVINIADDGTVLIDASNDVVNIDGNTTITGTLTVSDATTLQSTLDVTAAQTNSSTITASGEITGKGIKLSTHVHGGVKPGSAKTAVPE